MARPRSMKTSTKSVFVAVIAAGAIAGTLLAWPKLDPVALQEWMLAKRGIVQEHRLGSAVAFALVYAACAALALPGVWALSVAGGALFGVWLAVPIIALSSTVGATIAMLVSRYVLRRLVQAWFPDFVTVVDRNVARHGARWLFAARLIPVIPFFAINLSVGLTTLSTFTFFAVTLVGVLPFSTIYASAGAELSSIRSASDLLSAPVIVSLASIAAIPFLAHRIARWHAKATERAADGAARQRPGRDQPWLAGVMARMSGWARR